MRRFLVWSRNRVIGLDATPRRAGCPGIRALRHALDRKNQEEVTVISWKIKRPVQVGWVGDAPRVAASMPSTQGPTRMSDSQAIPSHDPRPRRPSRPHFRPPGPSRTEAAGERSSPLHPLMMALASLVQIVLINVVLSGDNALVIAMVARHLPVPSGGPRCSGEGPRRSPCGSPSRWPSRTS